MRTAYTLHAHRMHMHMHIAYTKVVHFMYTARACLQVLENLLLSHRLRVGRFPGPMYLACCEPGQARADVLEAVT